MTTWSSRKLAPGRVPLRRRRTARPAQQPRLLGAMASSGTASASSAIPFLTRVAVDQQQDRAALLRFRQASAPFHGRHAVPSRRR